MSKHVTLFPDTQSSVKPGKIEVEGGGILTIRIEDDEARASILLFVRDAEQLLHKLAEGLNSHYAEREATLERQRRVVDAVLESIPTP